MATTAQIDANHNNSRSSTGPRTETGKDTAARNAVKHGLSARHVLLPGEDPELFNSLLASIHDEFKPDGPTESFLADKIAEIQWKSLRISEMETALLTAPPEAFEMYPDFNAAQMAARVFENDVNSRGGVLEKLARYEANNRRAHDQYLRQLHFLQRQRRANAEKAARELERAQKEYAAESRKNIRASGKAVEEYMKATLAGDEDIQAALNTAVCKTKPNSVAMNAQNGRE